MGLLKDIKNRYKGKHPQLVINFENLYKLTLRDPRVVATKGKSPDKLCTSEKVQSKACHIERGIFAGKTKS